MERLRTSVIAAILLSACVTSIEDTRSGWPEPSPENEDSDVNGDSSDTQDVEGPLSWRLHDDIESLIYVSWQQEETGTGYVEYSVDPGVWLQSPARDFMEGEEEQLLLGIPYDSQVEIRLVSGGETTASVMAETGSIPSGFPVPTLLDSDPDQYEPTGNYLLGSINSRDGGWTYGQYWMFIVDRRGRIVWTHRGEGNHYTIYLHVSNDGDILWDVATFWSNYDEGADSRIHRMKIDGTIIESYDAPGMHHCFVELPDDSILWASADWDTEVLRMRRPDGSESVVWDCRDFEYLSPGDWCHSNSVFYRESTNTVLMSFPTSDSFALELDLDTGEVLHWWGHIRDAWDFEPERSAFWYQHGLTFTDTGNLLVSSHAGPSTDEGIVREYSLDPDSRVLTEVWSYGEGDGIDADNAGEAHRLPNGNTLHNTGTTPRIREITPGESEVVWDLSWSGSKLLGRTVFLEDIYVLAP